jgi:hypothetical protein
MPLYVNGAALIASNLERIRAGERARLVAIGSLTPEQVAAINKYRTAHNFPPIQPEVVFIGKHIFQSRIEGDGYTIRDVIEQMASAMRASSEVLSTAKMTALVSTTGREDRYGNCVRDRVVFECTARYPRPELFSVIPKGDRIKPKAKGATPAGGPLPNSGRLTG